MEQLYDLGIREQYVQLHILGLSDAAFLKPEFVKRRVVSKGALMFFPSLFVGQTGARVMQQLMQRDGSGMVPNSCFFYDAAYLYFYATQYLLESGQDYEDPYLIVSSMRNTHFYGCSGFFKIQAGTNDRDATAIAFTNFQYNSANDTYVLKLVGAYNPDSTQPYQFTSPIQWPDDHPTYADSKSLYGHCPYLAELVRDLRAGKVICLSVDFAVAGITLVMTVVIWKRWWNVRHTLLTQKQPIMLEDVLVLLTVGCDYFQFAAVGPDLSRLSSLAMNLSAAMGYNMQQLINITNGVYWVVLDCALALVVLWTIICLLKFTRVDMKMCSWLDYWMEVLLPTLGNLPIVSTLTSVYLCFQGTSDSLSDSFLNKDCYEHCWHGSHLGYAIGSGVGLVCYIPLAVFTRPLWQELQHNGHVKAQPLALMVKSAVQVFLIVLSNTLKREDPSTYACLFFGLITVYILFMLCFRQYNYDRLNMWQVVVMLGMLSLAIAAHLSSQFSTAFVAGLVVEHCVLGAGAVALLCFVPRFGVRLTRARSRDVRGLFAFAFTWGQRAKEGLEQFYTANAITSMRREPEAKT